MGLHECATIFSSPCHCLAFHRKTVRNYRHYQYQTEQNYCFLSVITTNLLGANQLARTELLPLVGGSNSEDEN
jgi:hypothetical protein